MILDKAQVELMEAEEVERNLRKLARTYKLDKPFKEWMTPELWDNLDNIINTLAYLEDRKTWLEQYGHLRGEEKV
jgi:ABC-type Fe3+-citrate transport system substrate-binding protein